MTAIPIWMEISFWSGEVRKASERFLIEAHHKSGRLKRGRKMCSSREHVSSKCVIYDMHPH
jgi:hypothetical protein